MLIECIPDRFGFTPVAGCRPGDHCPAGQARSAAFGPGAGADIGARVLADKLQTKWGKPVIVENRPGGDSMVAITAFLNADDDHTFLFAPAGNFTVHPFIYSQLPYDPKELTPIARVSNTILAVAVNADSL